MFKDGVLINKTKQNKTKQLARKTNAQTPLNGMGNLGEKSSDLRGK